MTPHWDWASLQGELRNGSGELRAHGLAHGLPWAEVSRESWLASTTFLSNADWPLFVDITAWDEWALPEPLTRADRFVVQLIVGNGAARIALRVRLRLSQMTLPSVAALWPGAAWFERELFDLYGVRFTSHPDLRRILLYPEFVGHPLRKDYEKTRRQPLLRVGPLSAEKDSVK